MTAKKRKHENPELNPSAREAVPEEELGNVYVTRGVPPMTVRVLANQNVKVPEDEHGPAGDFYEGDEFKTDGPTAHMLEARGIVEIIEEHE